MEYCDLKKDRSTGKSKVNQRMLSYGGRTLSTSIGSYQNVNAFFRHHHTGVLLHKLLGPRGGRSCH